MIVSKLLPFCMYICIHDCQQTHSNWYLQFAPLLSSFYGVQLQGLASAVGTFLGTCVRIPCEVMKQRLQVGRHTSVLEAAMKATEVEGPRGLFRGTTATLAREVPFYVFGMVGYEQLKKVANGASVFLVFPFREKVSGNGEVGRGPEGFSVELLLRWPLRFPSTSLAWWATIS
jgi:hypothetical protein